MFSFAAWVKELLNCFYCRNNDQPWSTCQSNPIPEKFTSNVGLRFKDWFLPVLQSFLSLISFDLNLQLPLLISASDSTGFAPLLSITLCTLRFVFKWSESATEIKSIIIIYWHDCWWQSWVKSDGWQLQPPSFLEHALEDNLHMLLKALLMWHGSSSWRNLFISSSMISPRYSISISTYSG